jgi:uncharacterized surface protein with fasciclin (FAS1) repeats
MRSIIRFAATAAVAVPLALSSIAAKAADIVDIAASDENFSTLVTAVKAAGLVDTLKGEGPFTVFAPTNDAFAKLPEGTVENLLKPENKDQLVAVLTYHVVPGKVTRKGNVGSRMEANTVEGDPVIVDLTYAGPKVNEAKITKADVMADNGVIHVIDEVILPPM